MNRTVASVLVLAVLAIGLGALWSWIGQDGGSAKSSTELLALGRARYTEHCASCHGGNLEGQPNWRERLDNGRLPAPPHDVSGHTWHHPDDMLFLITKEGTAAVVGGGYESDMPGFGGAMSDEEIRATLAYIKSTWPEKQRTYQNEMSSK